MNWSGGAFDPYRQLFLTNVNNLPIEVHLIPRERYLEVETTAKQGRFRRITLYLAEKHGRF